MASPILITGAAGRVGGIGRTITELLLKQGKPVRAMVRSDDQRAQALRAMGAEVVVGDLLDLDSMHRAIAGCETMYFGMSVSDTYLAATVNAAAVAKHHRVKAFVNMSQMTLAQMGITETTPSTAGGDVEVLGELPVCQQHLVDGELRAIAVGLRRQAPA